MVVAVPRRVHAVGPETLQVGGEIAGTTAGDQQIATELEVERLEPEIALATLDAVEALVGRKIVGAGRCARPEFGGRSIGVRRAQSKADPVKPPLVICRM